MTLPASYRNDRVGDGTTKSFPYTFKVWSAEEMRVVLADPDTGVVTEPTSGFSVTGVGSDGGNVVFDVAPVADTPIVFLPTTTYEQDHDLVNETQFFQERIEDGLDKLCRQSQLLKEEASRAIRIPEAELGSADFTLPPLDERKGKGLGFDGATGLPVAGSFGTITSAVMEPVVSAATQDQAADVFLTTVAGGVTARSARVRGSDFANVADFGAIGDGVSDDTTAINAAITAAGVNGVVVFPTPNVAYLVGEGHSVLPLDGQVLDLGGATIRKVSTLAARSDNLIEIDGKAGVTIRDGVLEKQTGNMLAVFVGQGSSRITLDNVTVKYLQIYVERSCSNISIRGGSHFCEDIQCAIACGSLLPAMRVGATGHEPGLVDGFTVSDRHFFGVGQECIDINWHTQNVRIHNCVINCVPGSIADDEVIDFGGGAVASGSVRTAGTGYTLNDVLTLSGGSTGTAATFTVTGVDGGGGVTAITPLEYGLYFRFPGTAAATTSDGVKTRTSISTTGGTGTSCALDATFGYCGRAVISGVDIRLNSAIEKRAMRVKWESDDVHITDCTVSSTQLDTSATVTSSQFLSIEQSDKVLVSDCVGRNLEQGITLMGPLDGVSIRDCYFDNINRSAIATGSITSTSDVSNVDISGVVIYAPNTVANEESVDLNYLSRFALSNVSVTLGSDTTVDGLEVRSGCQNGIISNLYVTGGSARGVITSGPPTNIVFYGWKTGVDTKTGNSSFTLTPLQDSQTQVLTGTLGGARTITLNTSQAYPGAFFDIVRTGAGAFAWDVGGLKSLSTGQRCRVTYDGSAWVLTEFSTL